MWEIDRQCPQCGAPVVMQETERFFSCPYCKVRLLIAGNEAVSYYLGDAAADGETLYVPYRRNRGMNFISTSSEATGSVVDKTSLASPFPFVPHSLGIRSQALRLKFVAKSTKGRFGTPHGGAEDQSLAESRQAILPGWAEEGVPATFSIRRFLSQASSFIYSPFRVLSGWVYDGISLEAIGQVECDFGLDESLFGFPQTQMTFTPALCPNCGLDLDGSKESIALPCRNCRLLWEASETGLTQKPFFSLPPEQAGKSILLPFWRIKARATGFDKPLCIDPRRSIPPAATGKPILFEEFRFWVPAFFIGPALFLRLSEKATMWQPEAEDRLCNEADQNAHLYPVTINASQAGRLLPIILSQIVACRESVLGPIVRGVLEPAESVIVFVPFAESTAELLHKEMRVGLLQTALGHGM